MFDIFDFITNIFKKDKSLQTKNCAKERLKLVLVTDRASVSPKVMESLKEELIQVISRYMTIDKSSMEMGLERKDGSVALAANIPIVNLRRNVKKDLSLKSDNKAKEVKPKDLNTKEPEKLYSKKKKRKNRINVKKYNAHARGRSVHKRIEL